MTWVREEEYNFTYLEKFVTNVLRCGEVPRHVALIMDGNRRYAKQNNLLKIKGHAEGFERLADTLQWCRYLGITEVTVYAFSIENFKRDKAEVEELFDLFREKIKKLISEEDKLREHGVKVRVIGNLSYLPADIQELIQETHKVTENNVGSTLNIAFSYTAREEITQAVRRAAQKVQAKEIRVQDIDEQMIESLLYTPSKVDLLVRTSGECRLSDFMLWQASSSVTYFTKVLWPDFKFWDLLMAVFFYQRDMVLSRNIKSLHTSNKNINSDEFAVMSAEKRFADTVNVLNSAK